MSIKVNADTTKYIVMSRDQNAGRSHNIKIDNSSFEGVEEFKYFETTLLDQNSFHEEIRSRLKLENVSYHSAQNLLSSNLVSKNKKTKI
jgi:ribosomal protein L15E